MITKPLRVKWYVKNLFQKTIKNASFTNMKSIFSLLLILLAFAIVPAAGSTSGVTEKPAESFVNDDVISADVAYEATAFAEVHYLRSISDCHPSGELHYFTSDDDDTESEKDSG